MSKFVISTCVCSKLRDPTVSVVRKDHQGVDNSQIQCAQYMAEARHLNCSPQKQALMPELKKSYSKY